MSVGLSCRTQKRNFKNAPQPYHDIENDKKIVTLNFRRNEVIISNVCFDFSRMFLYFCYHGNPSKEAKLITHVKVSNEENFCCHSTVVKSFYHKNTRGSPLHALCAKPSPTRPAVSSSSLPLPSPSP